MGNSEMTAESKKLAEDHLNLVNILVQKNLRYAFGNQSLIDEMKSVAEYHLCICACKYDPSKGSFAAYASRSINCVLHNLVKTERARGMTGLCKMTFHNINENVSSESEEYIYTDCKEFCDAEFIADLRRILTDAEITLLKFINDGHKKADIAEASGMSKSSVYSELKKIRKKLERILSC